LFGLKPIMIGDFNNGIIPKFEITELNIDGIHKGISKSQPNREDLRAANQKRLTKASDIFASINRRYNKFKYAYYNKGVENMNKAKITRCFQKTQQFLGTLNYMHRKLIAAEDPRAERFGKKVAEANMIVQKYGAALIRLKNSKCKNVKPTAKGKVQGNRNKVRK